MTILVATSISPVFPLPTLPVGVLGLGFIEMSDFHQNSFFNGGGPAPPNGEEVFGLFLGESGPELIIGGTDNSKFSGNLTIVDVNEVVSILRRVPCLCLTRTRYRVSGRSIWILSQPTILTFPLAVSSLTK
jgi:hypothetical protein